MKFVNSFLKVLQGRGSLHPPMRGGLTPSSALHPSGGCAPTTPMGRALRPSTPGDFPVAGKVTKGAPRASPFGIPRCEIFALFALAYASRRAGLCHRKRPICHFEMVGKSVLLFLWL